MAKGVARFGLLLALLCNQPAAHAAAVGSLLISEVMANPVAVGDSRGEWFELFNPSAEAIDLRDITIGDDGRDRHRIESDLLILPGHYLTLARNGDPAVNGGFAADYVYRDFSLANSSDEIVLRDDTTEWLRLEYGPGFAVAGRSRVLAGIAMTLANYQLAPEHVIYGLGDAGSPGSAGDFAPLPSAVPLPATAWLFCSGLLALAWRRLLAAAMRAAPGIAATRSRTEESPGRNGARQLPAVGC